MKNFIEVKINILPVDALTLLQVSAASDAFDGEWDIWTDPDHSDNGQT
ncbi:MAG: hypothetical protein IJ811_02450 [Clostridia bacterium]|nr:hypothetical protein [Clostridia bacterium]